MSKHHLISELSEEQLDELLAYAPDFSDRNLENIKRLSLEKINTPVSERSMGETSCQVSTQKIETSLRRSFSMKKLFAIAAAAVFLLATATTIFAATGGLEAFLFRFNPNFGEFAIAPLEPAYAESQGIRIEAVGAQQIGHVVLVYMTVQDISGENRLTRHMSADLEIFVDGEFMNGPSSRRSLNFDRATNTRYSEMIMVGEAGMPKAENIELRVRRIICMEHSGPIRTVIEGDWSMIVNTSDLGLRPITWTDIPAGSIHYEYISLSPFGLQMVGSHSYDTSDLRNFPFFEVEIELENRRRNLRLPGGGGGFGPDCFSNFRFAEAPIDLGMVTAVVINGERIPIPVE